MRAAGHSLHVFIVCVCVLPTTVVVAQTQTTGRITGIVRDVQGAAITNANISAEHAATGEKWTATTDKSGSFVILSLPPGSYHLGVQAEGFASTLIPELTVVLADTTNLYVVLQIAKLTVDVNLSDEPPLVTTGGSELGTTLESHTLSQLPTPGRNVL